MAVTELKKFSPQWTQGILGGSRILDENLAKIKAALDDANATIIRQQLQINTIITSTTVNISLPPAAPTFPPGFDADEDLGGETLVPGPPGPRGREGAPGMPGLDADADMDAGPAPAAASTLMARIWLSTPDPSVPNGVNMGALTTGILRQSVTAGVATPAIVSMPLTDRVMVSTGQTTDPIGNLAFQWDNTNRILYMGALASQFWSNLGNNGDVNYERVVASWAGNVFFLQSQRGGTGTLRSMEIDAQTASLTLNAAAGLVVTSTSLTVRSETGGTGHNLTITGNAGDGQFFATAFTEIVLLTNANSSLDLDSLRAKLTGSPTLASSAGLVLDAVKLSSGATVTGTTTIATATGFNFVAVPRPSIVKGDAGAVIVTNSASVYIENAPLPGASITITNPYALWVDAGVSRFDGDGTNVFELPADATVAGAQTGRIPIKVGGATVYLHYFNG